MYSQHKLESDIIRKKSEIINMAEQHQREFSPSISRLSPSNTEPSMNNMMPSPLTITAANDNNIGRNNTNYNRNKNEHKRAKSHKDFRGNYHKYSVELKVDINAKNNHLAVEENKDLLSGHKNKKRSRSPLPTPPPRRRVTRLNRSSSVPLEISSPTHHQLQSTTNNNKKLKHQSVDKTHKESMDLYDDDDDDEITSKYNKKQTFHERRKSKKKINKKSKSKIKRKHHHHHHHHSEKYDNYNNEWKGKTMRKQSEPVPTSNSKSMTDNKMLLELEINRRKSENNNHVPIPQINSVEINSPPSLDGDDNDNNDNNRSPKFQLVVDDGYGVKKSKNEQPGHKHVNNISSSGVDSLVLNNIISGSRTPSINSSMIVASPTSVRLSTEMANLSQLRISPQITAQTMIYNNNNNNIYNYGKQGKNIKKNKLLIPNRARNQYINNFNMNNNNNKKLSDDSNNSEIGPFRYLAANNNKNKIKYNKNRNNKDKGRPIIPPPSMNIPNSLELDNFKSISTATQSSKPIKQNKQKTPKINPLSSTTINTTTTSNRNNNNLNVLHNNDRQSSSESSNSSSILSQKRCSDTTMDDVLSETIGTTQTLPKSPINSRNNINCIRSNHDNNNISLKAIAHILKNKAILMDTELMSEIDFVEEPYNSDSNEANGDRKSGEDTSSSSDSMAEGKMMDDQDEKLNGNGIGGGYKSDDTIAISSMKISDKSSFDAINENNNNNNIDDKIAKFHHLSGYNSNVNLYQ